MFGQFGLGQLWGLLKQGGYVRKRSSYALSDLLLGEFTPIVTIGQDFAFSILQKLQILQQGVGMPNPFDSGDDPLDFGLYVSNFILVLRRRLAGDLRFGYLFYDVLDHFRRQYFLLELVE